jgi:hypothetical protein
MGLLFHAMMAQDVNPVRKVSHTEYNAREDDEDKKGQPPLQVEQQHNAAQAAHQIAHNVDNGAGEEPAQSLHVRGEARHEIARLGVVKEGFGESQYTFHKILLDVERYLLLKACKIEIFQEAHESLSQDDPNEYKYGTGQ